MRQTKRDHIRNSSARTFIFGDFERFVNFAKKITDFLLAINMSILPYSVDHGRRIRTEFGIVLKKKLQ